MQIKAVGIDIDGTMTDSGVYIDDNGNESMKFNRRDGHGISMLIDKGYKVVAVSSTRSKAKEIRCQQLKLYEILGVLTGKYLWIDRYLTENAIDWKEFAYIGDDINDLKVLEKCGFSGCPSDAEDEIRSLVDYVCKRNGGCGCVREFINKILEWNCVEFNKQGEK